LQDPHHTKTKHSLPHYYTISNSTNPNQALHSVGLCRATVASKLIIYCSPGWSGFCSVKDRDRINYFIKRSKRSGYCTEVQTVSELFAYVDKTLLEQVLANPNQTLHQFLLPINNHDHHLIKRPHHHQLTAKRTILQQSNFIIRSLFNNTY